VNDETSICRVGEKCRMGVDLARFGSSETVYADISVDRKSLAEMAEIDRAATLQVLKQTIAELSKVEQQELYLFMHEALNCRIR
jgi:uncharacterized membrane protein YukC